MSSKNTLKLCDWKKCDKECGKDPNIRFCDIHVSMLKEIWEKNIIKDREYTEELLKKVKIRKTNWLNDIDKVRDKTRAKYY